MTRAFGFTNDGRWIEIDENTTVDDFHIAAKHDDRFLAVENFSGGDLVISSKLDAENFSERTIAALKKALDYGDVVVKCGHCGQWGAVKTQCKHCGAPVG